MVPIYDTDIAEERWSKSEWEHYELWEKLEVRLRRRKRLWILAAVAVFIALFSIPILTDQGPKRASLTAVRQLAREINALKLDASIHHTAFRLRFAGDGSLRYHVEQLPDCKGARSVPVAKENSLESPALPMVLVSQKQGEEFGLPRLLEEFCYDSLAGSEFAPLTPDPVGFAVIPAKDLAEHRLDRLSLLTLRGNSAEISFE